MKVLTYQLKINELLSPDELALKVLSYLHHFWHIHDTKLHTQPAAQSKLEAYPFNNETFITFPIRILIRNRRHSNFSRGKQKNNPIINKDM